jgi:nitroreductase
LDIYEALYTTRAMRRMLPTSVPEDVQARILDAAIRAPTGGNVQQWRFILIDEAPLLAELGHRYRDCLAALWVDNYGKQIERAAADPEDPANAVVVNP